MTSGSETGRLEGRPLSRQRVAGAGLARAKYVLAVLTARGEGLTQNLEQAFCLCREAALMGEADAQFMLALMFERGEGTKKDLLSARHWCRLAKEGGIHRAGRKLREMERAR